MSPAKKYRKDQFSSGNMFQTSGQGSRIGAAGFAAAIATALHRDFGERGNAIKTIVRLTSANERAVKNWYEGHNGPSGEFLVLLCRHSDEVLESLLIMAGRMELVKAKKLVDAKSKLAEMLAIISQIDGSN